MNEQFGFKAKSSTQKPTFTLINEILEALNSKKVAFFATRKKLLVVSIMIYYYVNLTSTE